jgi:CAAX protease family protein
MSTGKQHWRIGFYVAAVLAAAWLWMGSFRLGFRPPEWVAILVLMWIPGLLAILFRVMFREGFADVGWQLGKIRFWAWAYLGPLALAAISVLIAWSAGLVRVSSRLPEQQMLYNVLFKLPWFTPDASARGLLGQRFLAVACIDVVVGFFFALGEELGWRGYLLPRMVRARWPVPLILSGLILGVWHFPIFVFTGYAHGFLLASLGLFTFIAILFSVFIGWLRLASGSVFVAAMAHASFNAFVQSFFGLSFVGDGAWFLIGDYGVLTILPYAILAVYLWRSKRVHTALAASRAAS